jgi:hypothetical protein
METTNERPNNHIQKNFLVTDQLRNKCLFLFLMLSSVFAGCSNNKSQSKLVIDTTEHISKNPKSSIKAITSFILRDSLISFLNRCKIVSVNKQASIPFNKLKYNKVIAYNYDGVDGEHVFRIVENNKLILKIKQQRQLNQKQVDDLTNWLGAISTYGGTYAFCFEPNLGIVFYYNNKIAANISISTGCNFLDSSVPISATKAKTIEISKDHKYPAKGFSKIGNERLISLAKDLNLSLR